MSKVYIALADGFEEAEAILPYDILRRARIEVTLVSITGNFAVSSSHGVTVTADTLLADADMTDGDLLFLPGGMPGAIHLSECEPLARVIGEYAAAGKYLAAVCAAPMVYGQMGLLQGREATCYPGFEDKLVGARIAKRTVVQDGNFITGCGAGAGFALGAKMAEVLVGADTAAAVLRQMMFEVYDR